MGQIIKVGKFKYMRQLEQRSKSKKAPQPKSRAKNLQIRIGTEPADIALKVKQSKKFLKKGKSVKWVVIGRNVTEENCVNKLKEVQEFFEEGDGKLYPIDPKGSEMLIMPPDD